MPVVYGSFVATVRRSRGLTQAQLAEVSGVDHRLPSADTLNRLLVACGYQLAAVAGDEALRCPLPKAGWFPDEDTPPPLADDPVDDEPVVTETTAAEVRAAALTAALEAASAIAEATSAR